MESMIGGRTSPMSPRRVHGLRANVCTQCRRLKRKCDRQTPCSTCVHRQIPHQCHLPSSSATRASLASSNQAATPQPHSECTRQPSGDAQTPRPPTSSKSGYHSSRIGHLLNSRGAPSYHGSSYFGHQSAASLISMESPELPIGMSSINNPSSRPNPRFHRDEKGPYSHIWELVGYLPRRKALVDHRIEKFFKELNPVYDAVHRETFQTSYDAFWDRKWGDDDLTAVDLRWLALLFMMLAFAELLDCPPEASTEVQKSCEETSVQFFWGSRKAIVMAPTLSGESPDLVRAGILVSRYLMYWGRKTESWLTSSFAIRMAQAQGMHVDGESWGLPPKVLETRRRLWCTLYSMDRSISLATGRPYTINSKHCMEMNIRNIWIDDKSPDEAAAAVEQPIERPTASLYYKYQQKLSAIMGDIHDDCFGLVPMTTSYHTYEKVLSLDKILLDWAASLPVYFRLDNPDTSLDVERPFLSWQRMYLHSSYHFARITLHRTYVLLESITDRFQYSRTACITSACADLRLKLSLRNTSMADRLLAGAAMHNLFNSALVLGIIAVKDPRGARTGAILEDLSAYCEKMRADTWANEFVMAEVKVIELCIATARKASRDEAERLHQPPHVNDPSAAATAPWQESDMSYSAALDVQGPYESWLDSWFGPTRTFPEPIDYQFWEDLVGTLEAR
ncbi:fungal-specific transcription factor domain-containing protein [Emericellopsis atlantica]|uniref:Fungal-specific transcription factor domain-containing protein n=1 Tax=Emericellopsis atlantica TaxID=2614577 RepID=A0A9P7ZJ15_9HYPO|nr:fungal-specific transcription factor domain-containing protein [Emericellopsis atlantica]KAG9253009.1 fungal-specific transcription factor domain-containing protein [Emericellopsis atlantica]